MGRRLRKWWHLAALTTLATVVVPVSPAAPAVGDPVLVGAGDIATCSRTGDEATAALLDQVVGANPDATVFTTGDNVYN
ncbi:MAG: hypothetical protein ACRD0O_05300, partial [Acidimicrobiia bacterium]